MMAIRKWILLLVLFNATISLASNQRDSISIDPRWNYWGIRNVSAQGDWVLIGKNHINAQKDNKIFAMHTANSKRVDVTDLQQPAFTGHDKLIGIQNGHTIELNLKTETRTSLGVLRQKQWLESQQLFTYITSQDEWVMLNYDKKENSKLFSKKGIARFFINPSQTKIVYQEKNTEKLWVMDIKTFKERSLGVTGELLEKITWNIQEDAVAAHVLDHDILFVDLEAYSLKKIELPKSESPIAEFKLSFFTNNDMYISYILLNEEADPVADYLEIWNGNDRDLKNKVHPRLEGDLKAWVYEQNSNQLIELPRSLKKDYLNMGVEKYLLVYAPLELQDYSQMYEKVRYRLFNLKTLQEEGELTTTYSLEYQLNRAPNGQALLYPKDNLWECYDFKTQQRFSIPHVDDFSEPLWSSDSQQIYFQDTSNLFAFDVCSQKSKALTNFEGRQYFTVQNKEQIPNSFFVDLSKPLAVSIRHQDDQTTYGSLFRQKWTYLLYKSNNKLNMPYLNRGISRDAQTLVWTEENYKQPHTVKIFRKGKVSTLLKPEVPEELYSWRKQKVIHYKDKYGVDLTGVLWYPKDFDKTKKYPMITWIYDLGQGNDRSLFDIPTLYNQHGFNRALLNELGYFVFQADTYVSDEGPGVSAVECVTQGIKAITAAEPAIHVSKIGLIGHSFGGYKTSFILGNSKLFATGISGSATHDLVGWNYEYNYYRRMPNWFMVEKSQYRMKDSFGANPTKYFKNSPIHFAQYYSAPILLWVGLKDYNAGWEYTRHMYVALQRYHKPVIALFYKNQGHSLTVHRPKEQVEFTLRALDWFSFFLNDNKEIQWISKNISYSDY